MMEYDLPSIAYPPTDLYVTDNEGNRIDSLTVPMYSKIDTVLLKCNGTKVTWSVSPSLPQGLIIHSSYGYISGVPTESIPKTLFSLTAANEDGNATITFPIEVVACKHGDYLLPRIFGSQKGTFEISQDGEVFYNQLITSGDIVAICIPPGTYTYMFNCTSSVSKPYKCAFQLEDEHYNFYLKLYSLQGVPASGTFETVATKKPEISMKSVIAAYRNQHIREFIDVVGVHSNITVTPSLPEGLVIDQSISALTGFLSEKGVYDLTITAGNKFGNSSISISIGLDTCPQSYDLVVFKRPEITAIDIIQFYDPEGAVLFDNDFSYDDLTYNFCLKEGTYTFNFGKLRKGETGWDETNPLMIYDDMQLMSSFLLDQDLASETRHFSYAIPVRKNSTFHFSQTHDNKWTSLKFKDSEWKEGAQDKWGTLTKEHPSLYLRKTFNIPSLAAYSHLHVDVRTNEQATVYLNEHTLLSTVALANYTRYTFFLDKLVEGHNILAVELHQANSSFDQPISFDISLKVVTSNCVAQNTGGVATDSNPNPSEYFPVAQAFDLDPKTYWNVRILPITARYTFPGNVTRVMNTVKIKNTVGDHPSSIRIQGVDGNDIVDLASIESKTFMSQGTYQYIRFDNTKAYSAYQIVFEKTVNNNTMSVHDIRFLACNPITCSKKWGLAASYVNTVVQKSCPIFKTGTKQMRCRNVDNKPVWVEDLTACGPRYPKKGISYLDWSVKLYNVTTDNVNDVKPLMTTLITKNLRVQEEEIGYVLASDISTPEISILRLDIRFTFELEIGDYILKHVKAMMPDFNDLVKTYFKKMNPDASGEIMDSPALRVPVNVGLIVTISVIIVVALCLGVYFKVRLSKKADGSQPRTLRKTYRKKREEDKNLLSEVLCVCFTFMWCV